MECYITKKEERNINFFKNIHSLDMETYSEEYVGKLDSMLSRNNDSDIIIVVKNENRIIGYMDILSLKEETYKKIINSNIIVDDEISLSDLKNIDEGNYLYILSIVIKKEYQNGETIKLILEKYKNFVESININDILATTISEDGYKFIKRLGFKEIKQLKENETLFSFNYGRR